MKNNLGFTWLIIFITTNTFAQNFNISFTASGITNHIDSIWVENISKATSISIQGTDVLHLTVSNGIMQQNTTLDKLEIIPNPMPGHAQFSFYSKKEGNVQILVNDISGKTLIQLHNQLSKGIHRYEIINLNEGIYILFVKGGNYQYTAKLLSQNNQQSITCIKYLGMVKAENNYIIYKNAKSIIELAYSNGDSLKFTGFCGIYTAIVKDVPTASKTIIFNFITQPTVTTNSVISITSVSAVIEGTVTSDGGDNVTARGISWDTITNPNITGFHTIEGTGSGTFNSYLFGLVPGTLYYVKAYAVNSVGTSYGSELSFKTLSVPSVTTANITNITNKSAMSGGRVSSDGGAHVISRGICWSKTSIPTITDSINTAGSDTGSFNFDITGLSQGTTYYVRAFATNSVGTAYGNQQTFSTTVINLPVVKTYLISGYKQTFAYCDGEVTSEGGAPVTSRGVCWSKNLFPTLNDSFTVDGSGTGKFTSFLNNLTPYTLYYIRAYATNLGGTSYGVQNSFRTWDITPPTLTTTGILSITDTSATSGGNIIYDCGANVTARGICWDTLANPTINRNFSSDSFGTGIFASKLTSLKRGKKYYVKAYATNSAGTGYGNELNFTTLNYPTLTTSAFWDIKGNSARSGGTTVSNGGSPIMVQGLCWSSSPNPTISNNYNHTFFDTITGLSQDSIYYVRAYATNGVGTGYGNELILNAGKIIGSAYGGGLVFYNDGHGHGTICSDTNLSMAAEWGCSLISISGTSLLLMTGEANTNAIVATCTQTGIAAKLCYDLVRNGYGDWYLPSLGDFLNLSKNLFEKGLCNFSNNWYWSSSEGVPLYYTAYAYRFINGGSYGQNFVKTNQYYVRAVRSF